jgi:hypothetical protein
MIQSQKGTAMSERVQLPTEFVPNLDELKNFSRDRCLVEEIQRGHSALRSHQHKQLRTALARLYAFACFLREDEDAWLDFCRDNVWGSYRRRPKKSDRDDALRYVVRVAVGFNGRPATKRASKYYARLSGWFTAEIPPKIATERILRNKPRPMTTRGSSPEIEKQSRQKEEYATLRIPLNKGGRGVLEKGVGECFTIKLRCTDARGNFRNARVVKTLKKRKRLTGWLASL